jgi:hypothetical protein
LGRLPACSPQQRAAFLAQAVRRAARAFAASQPDKSGSTCLTRGGERDHPAAAGWSGADRLSGFRIGRDSLEWFRLHEPRIRRLVTAAAHKVFRVLPCHRQDQEAHAMFEKIPATRQAR